MALAARGDQALAGRIIPATDDELTVVDEADLAVREALGSDYKLEGFLGQGGMSVVFLAREVNLNRLVALKVLPRRHAEDSSAVERFRQEASIAASLDHPNIVAIHRFGTNARGLWYTMKYIRGRSLEELLRDTGPLDLHDCFSVVEQVAGALHYAHRRGVVHRDMKPANVMLDENGWAFVCDFGVAKALGSPRLTQTGGTLGTPLYMSPEQLYGQTLDGRSDQYSLAVVTFELLTGVHPFAADAVGEIIRRHCMEVAPSLAQYRPDLPVRVADGLARAMSKKPDDRFPDVVEFLTSLGGRRPRRPLPTHRVETVTSGAVTAPLEQSRPKRRRRVVALAAAGLVAAAAIAGVVVPRLPQPAAPIVAVPLPAAALTAPASVEERELAPVLETGRLFVSSEPWGRLSIDGSPAGRTPAIDLPIAAGTHRIRIERDGYAPFEQEIRVEPGAQVRRTGIRLEATR
ncbi:MAG: protein kinase [Gemmatimonadota bacterium]|nr:protein kinase [Gemmatimonadota bacterium]